MKNCFLFKKKSKSSSYHNIHIKFGIINPMTSDFPLAFTTKSQVCFFPSPVFLLFILLFLISSILILLIYFFKFPELPFYNLDLSIKQAISHSCWHSFIFAIRHTYYQLLATEVSVSMEQTHCIFCHHHN